MSTPLEKNNRDVSVTLPTEQTLSAQCQLTLYTPKEGRRHFRKDVSKKTII